MADTARRVYGQEASDIGLSGAEAETYIQDKMAKYVQRFVNHYNIEGEEKETILGDPEACLDDPGNLDDFILMSLQ